MLPGSDLSASDLVPGALPEVIICLPAALCNLLGLDEAGELSCAFADEIFRAGGAGLCLVPIKGCKLFGFSRHPVFS